MSNADSGVVSVRYIIDDVDAAVAFYTKHFGFTVDVDYAPTFASVSRGNLRLLLSGEKTSGRKAMIDGTKPVPGGWNRILLMVSDNENEAKRLRAAGVKFRRDDIVSGPGGWRYRSDLRIQFELATASLKSPNSLPASCNFGPWLTMKSFEPAG
jgi:catechol 2,3-dioxygenase-like lactoylglutathione lyase family enzyme